MTPKEKAEKLVFDMDQRIEQNCNQSSRLSHYAAAKECAIIAVADMIWWANEDRDDFVVTLQYWQQVKEEIEKL